MKISILLCFAVMLGLAAETPVLMQTVLDGDRGELERTLQQGADPNAGDDHGQTALHLSAATADFGALKLLLDHGADPNKRDLHGMTPLAAAAGAVADGTAVEAIVTLLLSYGADPNPLGQGLSPLAFAMQRDHEGAVAVLKDAGAVLGNSESLAMLEANQLFTRAMKSAIFESTRGQMSESEFMAAAREAITEFSRALRINGMAVPESQEASFLENSREQYRNLVLVQESKDGVTQ